MGAAAGARARNVPGRQPAASERRTPMDRVYTIRTPEMVRLDFRLAGPASRFFAWAIDMAILIAALAIFAVISCIISAFLAWSMSSQAGVVILVIGSFTLYYGYF